jgi:hypothetical protein
MKRVVALCWLVASLFADNAMIALAVTAEDLARPRIHSSNPSPIHSSTSNVARCTVREEPDGCWLVSPTGKRFFSLGVCVFSQGSDRKSYDSANPSFAAWQHYESPDAWATANVQRLKSWGFTTLGGWSDYKIVEHSGEHGLWMTPAMAIGVKSGAPWFDMWDDRVISRIEELAKEAIVPLRDDPHVIGYYSDNEIGWWNAILWKMALEQPPSSGQRQRLIRLARETYGNDWEKLVGDFEPQNAASWQELDQGGMLWLRPGGNGIRTMRRFLGLVAERYYQVMRDTIHKFDPDAMYLGDRYQSFYYPEVATASRRNVDIVSTNLNASWNDGTFAKSYLDTLHALTGKPVLVSEFYMAAAENGSGNKNATSGFPTVATQPERATAAAKTINALLRLPYVVGADWFQYYDEPPKGREDGEDYNFGLVDIHNRPYAEVTATFASADVSKLKSKAAPRRPNATAGVPPAPREPLSDFRFMTALKSWDRERGFVPSATKYPLGDLYICWSGTALYLGTFVTDIVEPVYYRDGEIPESDRATWVVQLNGREPITAHLGAGKKATIDDPALRLTSLSGTYHNVRCITAIEVPAKQLGKEHFAPGDQISLKSTFTTHARAYRMEWNGNFVLSP